MNIETNTVIISKREYMYLRNTTFLPAALVRIIDASVPVRNDDYAVHVSRETAEQFRSIFTERLAKVGFGPDYEPTPEGRLLEQLIDRFYLS